MLQKGCFSEDPRVPACLTSDPFHLRVLDPPQYRPAFGTEYLHMYVCLEICQCNYIRVTLLWSALCHCSSSLHVLYGTIRGHHITTPHATQHPNGPCGILGFAPQKATHS